MVPDIMEAYCTDKIAVIVHRDKQNGANAAGCPVFTDTWVKLVSRGNILYAQISQMNGGIGYTLSLFIGKNGSYLGKRLPRL